MNDVQRMRDDGLSRTIWVQTGGPRRGTQSELPKGASNYSGCSRCERGDEQKRRNKTTSVEVWEIRTVRLDSIKGFTGSD